jgi:hypothetical protein
MYATRRVRSDAIRHTLRNEGYWQARQANKATPVYQKAIAALLKMKELNLIYVDQRLHAEGQKLRTGIISTSEYDQTWAKATNVRSYLTGGHYESIEGVSMYEGLAVAIKEIEGRGYRYVEGQGYVGQ